MYKDEATQPTPPVGGGGNCAAGDDMTLGLPLAMAYIPKQEWRLLYTPDRALEVGTLFTELHLPFEGVQMGVKE